MLQPPLRIGIALDDTLQPRWVSDLVAALREAPFADIVLAIRSRPRPGRRRLIRTLYTHLDAAYFRRSGQALRRVDLAPLLADVPTVTADDTQVIAELDVVLSFCARPADAPAKFGVWSIAHDAFHSFVHQRRVTTARLRSRGDTVARTVAGTDPISFHRGTSRIATKSVSMTLRALEKLHRRKSAEALFEEPSELELRERDVIPALAAAARRLVVQTLRDKAMREQWFVAFDFGHEPTAGDFSAFHRIVPPADRLWADPFVVRDGDRAWIFVEELVHREGKGVLAVIEARNDGTWIAPRRILERPYHLSYPHVFRWNGQWYMVPESAQNGTIDLYRCASFPLAWEHEAVLMSGVQAVDSTLFEHEGRWWMFTSTSVDGAVFDELSLYFAEGPAGPWSAHPMNPIVSDVRFGRCAGRPFLRDGALIRSAQDGARRYGHSIELREIVTLTPELYQERPAGTILPRWAPRLAGTHTLNADDGVTVIDGLWYRLGR